MIYSVPVVFFFYLNEKEEKCIVFFFQAEDGIRDGTETGVQTCALPIYPLVRDAARQGRRRRRRRRGHAGNGGTRRRSAPAPRGRDGLGRDAGRRAPLSRHERGVREGARAVRTAHRLLPGHPPSLRRDANGGGECPRRRLLRRVGADGGRRGRGDRLVDLQVLRQRGGAKGLR